jgi:hypothetical protein
MPPRGLLVEDEDPRRYAPIRPTVLEAQVREGLRRASKPFERGAEASYRSKLSRKARSGDQFEALRMGLMGVQDLLGGATQAVGAPVTSALSLLAPAAEGAWGAVKDTAAGREAQRAAGNLSGAYGRAVGAVSDATGYPADYTGEALGAGLLAAAGPAAKGFTRAAGGAEALANRAGYTFLPQEGTLFSGVGPTRMGHNGGPPLDGDEFPDEALSLRRARELGIRPTTKNTQRVAFPGIYKHPNVLADDAAALVAPESPALKGLFGVTRDDLYQMNKGRKGNVDATVIFPTKGRGSEAARNIITDKNAQRMLDAMSVAEQRAPQLTNPMDAWYVMDPAFQRLEQLVGREEAIRRFNDLNAFTSMASPASDVITEMNRGTTANYLNRLGRFEDFEKYSTTPVSKRDGGFPADIAGLKPHAYGGTAHAQPMRKYVDGGLLDNGFLNVDTSKVPTYHMASGVPETGFQTNVPVGDAHFARAIGLPDVRNMQTRKGKPIIPQANADMPEVATLTPWWQQKVVGPLGIESVPGQARAWGLFSPQTGVDTPIGAPKLELMAAEIDRLARQAGVDPAQLRDAILMGQAGLGSSADALPGLLGIRPTSGWTPERK